MEKHKLTSSQMQIIRMCESFSGTTICNNCYEVKMNYEKKEIEKAVCECIQRNPVLKSKIVKEENEYYCVIDEENESEPHILLSVLKDEEEIDKFKKQPLDIFQGEYIKFAIRYKNNDLYVLGITHHLFFDAASGYYMLRFIKEYLDGNKNISLADNYLKYFEEEQKYRLSPKYLEDKAFWEKVFAEKYNPSPISRKEARVIDIEAKRKRLKVDSKTLRAIRDIENRTSCGVFDIYMASLSLYLSLLNENADRVCFGTTMENRSRKFKETIGMFVNVLNVPISIDYGLTGYEYIKYITSLKNQYILHRLYPYSEVLEYTQEKHKMNKLYHVMLSYQPPRMVTVDNLDEFEWHFGNYVESDCNMHVLDNGEEIVILYDYKIVLFDDEEIKMMHKCISTIIQQLSDCMDDQISEIGLCSKDDYNLVMKSFNKEIQEKDCRLITDIVKENGEKYQDRIAVIYKDKQLTYRQLVEQASFLAKRLIEKGVKRGERVGVLVDRSEKTILSFLAILFSGATYIPMDKGHPLARREYVIENSEVRYLIVDEEIHEHEDVKKISFDRIKEDVNGIELPYLDDEDAIVYVLYTSGSTGRPKGVKIKNSNIINLIQTFQDEIYRFLSGTITVGLTASFNFDASVQQIYAALLLGNTLHIIPEEDKRDGISYYKYVSEHEFDVLDMTPSHFTLLMDGNVDFKKVLGPKYLLVGGEAMRSNAVSDFLKMFHENMPVIYNVYGPTECCVDSTLLKVTSEYMNKYEIVPIGKPINNMKAYVLNSSKKMVSVGQVGELYLSGYGVGDGYIQLQEETNKRFVEDPFTEGFTMYQTGDMVKFLETGTILYIDRMDNQVKIHGYRIELDEIEQTIYEHPDVKQVAVTTNGEGEKKEIVAFIVAQKDCSEQEIVKYIIGKLPGYMVPQKVILVEEMPLNQSGKIDKKTLVELYVHTQVVEVVQPTNEMERKLLEIWKQILNRTDFGVLDDFFDLGGHSLNMTALMVRIAKEFGYQPTWRVLLDNTNIRDLAVIVEKNLQEKDVQIKPMFNKSSQKDYYEVSSTQKRMYLTQMMSPQDVSNNSPIFMNVKGKLDVERLKNAVQNVIDRHEALRTVFEMREGNLVQRILEHVDLECKVEKGEKAITELMGEGIYPFDLQKGPLIRMCIAERAELDYYVVIDMHHIVTDGESYKIVLQEISDYYNGNELKEIEYQYRDFSEWQNDVMCKSTWYQNQGEYWKRQFENGIPMLKLPYDYFESGVVSNEGRTINRKLSRKQVEKLKLLAKEEDVTLFMIMFSLYSILLKNMSNSEEFVIAIPVAARTQYEFLSIVGYCVNLVPLKITFEIETFRSFLQKLKTISVKAYENQDYLFEDMFGNAKEYMDGILKVGFTETKNIEPLKLNRVKTSIINPEYPISKYDLLMNLLDSEEEMIISLSYRTQLFMHNTVEIMMDRFLGYMDKVMSDPNVQMKDLIEAEKEEECLLFAF